MVKVVMGKHYAVRVGRKPGVYRSAEQFHKQLCGFSGAKGKAFKTEREALRYVNCEGAIFLATLGRIPVLDKWHGEGESEESHRISTKEMTMEGHHFVFFDGSFRGPSLAGCGALICDHVGHILWEGSYNLTGVPTSLVAEYMGLILGMEAATRAGIRKLIVMGDQKSLIDQMRGECKGKSEYMKAKRFEKEFDEVHYCHVCRKYNKDADKLARLASESAPKGNSLEIKAKWTSLAHMLIGVLVFSHCLVMFPTA